MNKEQITRMIRPHDREERQAAKLAKKIARRAAKKIDRLARRGEAVS